MSDIQTFILKGLLTFFGAWLTLQFALRKFYAEKRWERKEEAYSMLLEQMHDTLMYHDEWVENSHQYRNLGTDAEKRQDEQMGLLLRKSKKAEEAIRRFDEIGAFFVDEQVVQEIQQMRRTIRKLNSQAFDPENNIDEVVEEIADTIRVHLNRVREAMKKDLGLRPNFWPRFLKNVWQVMLRIYRADYSP